MLYDKQNNTRFLIGFKYDLLKDRRIGDVSINKIWVRQFAKRYCKNIDIKLVFLGNMFGVKDPIPRVWFTSCNACYVGETSRHLSTRVSERLVSDRTSHIFRHLPNSPQCRTFCSDECFNILDHASTTFQPKIKEAIHIQWEKLTPIRELYHVNLKLSL